MTAKTQDIQARFGLALSQDSFTRADRAANTAIATGFGTASDGEAWTQAGGGGSPVTWAITSNEGVIAGAVGVNYAILGSGTDTNMKVTARFSVSNTLDAFGVILCYTGTGNHYRVRYNNGALDIIRLQGGTSTTISTIAFTLTVNTYYHITGSIFNGVLSGKIWADGAAESTATKAADVADSTFTSGQYGFVLNLNNAAHVVNVDHFVVTDVSVAAVSGITKDILCRFGVASVGGDSPYGFDIERKINNTTGALNFVQQHVIDNLASIGVKWLRVQILWNDIETNPTYPHPNGWTPAYQWNLLDDALYKCKNAQKADGTPAPINVVVPIQDTPAVYMLQSCGANGHLPDPTETARFAAALATRYNGVNDCISNPNNTNPTGTNYGKLFIPAIHYNEIFSNPGNPGSPPSGCGDPQFWIDVHKLVYPAIKANSPTALVGAPSLTTGMHFNPNDPTKNDLTYIQGWCTKACQQLFPNTPIDFWDFHFYHSNADPLTNDTGNNTIAFDVRWQMIQSVTNQFGLNIPIWCCEYGYRGGTDKGVLNADVTYAVQSQFSIKEIDNARTSGVNGVKKMFWFTIGGEVQATSDPTKYDQPFNMTACRPNGTNDGLTAPSPLVQGTASAPYNANSTPSVKPPLWNDLYAYMQLWPTWGGSGGGGYTAKTGDILCRFGTTGGVTAKTGDIACRFGLAGGKTGDIACRFHLTTAVGSPPPSLSLSTSSRDMKNVVASSRAGGASTSSRG